MNSNPRIPRRNLIPVAAALAFASMEAGLALSARRLVTEVQVTSKRLGLDPVWGTAYLVTLVEADGTPHEMPVSSTAWDWLRAGDVLPARRSSDGRLFTVEMRYER